MLRLQIQLIQKVHLLMALAATPYGFGCNAVLYGSNIM
jgi:hypothetical protein